MSFSGRVFFSDSSHGARFLAAACALALVLASAGCKSEYPASGQQKGPADGRGGAGGGAPRQVKMGRVEEMPVGASVNVTGTLAAQDEATLSIKVPGRVASIAVDLGSVVRRGQVVAQVEQQDYRLRVQQAEAALQQARARLGLAPQGDSDRFDPETTGTVRSARATLEEARQNRARVVQLVESGVVARAEYESADAAFKVAQGKYQDAVEEIRNRQALLAQRRTELSLARLSPTINQQNRVLVVEAEIANPGGLRPGGFARAEIVTNSGDMAVTVPANAVVTFAGIEKVITVENGKAKERPITTGRHADTWTEVLSGVGVGESVVLDPGNL